MSPSGVGRETGLQGRLGRELASGPFSSFSLLHLSPRPRPGLAQSCGHCRMPCPFLRGLRWHRRRGLGPTPRRTGDKEGELSKGEGFSFSSPRLRACGVEVSSESEKRNRPHKCGIWAPAILP